MKAKLMTVMASAMFALAIISCASHATTTTRQEVVIKEAVDGQTTSGQKWTKCATCKGQGSCRNCKGTGKIGNTKCTVCEGNGKCAICNGQGGYGTKRYQ